jgi:hypothetical protein
MIKRAFCALLALLLCSGVVEARTERDAKALLQEVIAVDREFGAVPDLGIVEKLTRQFSEEVVMPLPAGAFARGKAAVIAAMSASPANRGKSVAWEPLSGGISADGTHAFTYGYTTSIGDDGTARHGKYMAYWVRGSAGWRVAAYKRAPRPPEGALTTSTKPVLPKRIVKKRRDGRGDTNNLIAAEEAFAAEAQVIGIGPAFRKYGSPLAVNFGPGSEFVVGNEAIADGVGGPEQAASSPVSWGADEGALVAPSGDLGITFGRIRPKQVPPGQPDAISFFTIWQRDGLKAPWRYVAE